MIPLYTGELHKVSDVPRKWVIPRTQVPLSVFRNAVEKRNAAVNECLQSLAAEKANDNGHASPGANGMVETSAFASADGLGDHEHEGGSENDGDSTPDGRAGNGAGSSVGKPSSSIDRSGRAEEEIEKRLARKRRREDSHYHSGPCIERKEDSARRDGGESDAPSRGNCKVLHEGSEPVIVDVSDHAEPKDCDDNDAEKALTDSDHVISDQARVRVSDLGNSSEMAGKQGDCELGVRAAAEAKPKDAGNLRRNGEVTHPAATTTAVSSFEETKSAQVLPTAPDGNPSGGGAAGLSFMELQMKRKEELEAKRERLRAEKHRLVLRLKEILHEEEVKKRGSPATVQGAVAGANDATGVSIQAEKLDIGVAHKSTDLEDGELEYARTPSPLSRTNPNSHVNVSSHVTPGPPPLAPVTGRQTSLSQHLSQSAPGRGGYYALGPGIPPSPSAPGMSGAAQSSGAYQHAAAIHSLKVTSVSHGHGQFSPAPSTGAPVGAGLGVSGGPPGFSGYPMSSSSVHSHHSHLPQAASSSLPHIVGQQGVSPSSVLKTRGPPGYHDVRMGSSTWIQR